MPIIDIDCVGAAAIDVPQFARTLAKALGECLQAPAGSLWVRVRTTDASDYAENGPAPEVLPVFVRVLARQAGPGAVAAQARSIAETVARAVQRPVDAVHVIFEPDAPGRVFFGGRADGR